MITEQENIEKRLKIIFVDRWWVGLSGNNYFVFFKIFAEKKETGYKHKNPPENIYFEFVYSLNIFIIFPSPLRCWRFNEQSKKGCNLAWSKSGWQVTRNRDWV